MKLTQQQLKQLIKEELQKALKEVKCPAGCVPAPPKKLPGGSKCKADSQCASGFFCFKPTGDAGVCSRA